MRNVLIGIAIAALAVGTVIYNMSGSSNEGEITGTEQHGPISPDRDVMPEEGFAAPDFTLNTLSGDTIRLYDNDGKPSLINFWASWCPPCKEEMPHLQEAYEMYGDDVNFLMIDLTFSDNFDNMIQYIEDNNFTFPVLLDETGDVAQDYQIVPIPTSFVVDETGVIVQKVQGSMTRNHIMDIMEQLTR